MILRYLNIAFLGSIIGVLTLSNMTHAGDVKTQPSKTKYSHCWEIGQHYILEFNNPIYSDDAKPIRGFELSSDGENYHTVDAEIGNNRVILRHKIKSKIRFVRYTAQESQTDNLIDSNGPLDSFSISITEKNCLVSEILKQAKATSETSPYQGYKHIKEADLFIHPDLTFLNDYDLGKLRYVTTHHNKFYGSSGTNTYTSEQLKVWHTLPTATKGDTPVTRKETWATVQWVNNNHYFMLYLERSTKNIKWGPDGLFTPDTRYETYIVDSFDHCKTWENKRPFVKGFTSGASLCKLPSGRIIMACHQYSFKDKSSFILIKTTDDGVTWHRKENIAGKGIGTHAGISEANLIAVNDKTVLLFYRTGEGKVGLSKSTDRGNTFHEVECEIPASSSALAVSRLPDNRLLIAYNSTIPKAVLQCDENIQQSYRIWLLKQKSNRKQLYSIIPHNWFRSELSVRISSDNANSWSDPIMVAHRSSPLTRPLIRCASPTIITHEDNVYITSQEGLKARFKPTELFKK